MKYSLLQFKKLKINRGTHKVHIVSGSMEPWIGTNEVITVQIASIDEVSPYDIVVFWENDIFICHILISKSHNSFQTKALATNEFDDPIDNKYLLGKVVSPKFSWWQKVMLRFLT